MDHAELIQQLTDNYPDGWALSTSSTALQGVIALCPSDCRVAAWVKPFAVFKPNVNPAYAWEPVIFRGGRRGDRTRLTVRDWHSESITLRRGLVGVKPPGFNRWITMLLGMVDGDTLDDIYPGSNGMATERQQRVIALRHGSVEAPCQHSSGQTTEGNCARCGAGR